MRESQKAARVLPELWYENEKGERWIPPSVFVSPDEIAPPPGYVYQASRFALDVHERVLRCHADRSEAVMSGTSSYSGELALALARPTLLERWRATIRYGWPGPRLPVRQAVLHAAVSCERCVNLLAHRVGLPWGYRARSNEDRAHTSCERCTSPRKAVQG